MLLKCRTGKAEGWVQILSKCRGVVSVGYGHPVAGLSRSGTRLGGGAGFGAAVVARSVPAVSRVGAGPAAGWGASSRKYNHQTSQHFFQMRVRLI